MSSRFWYAVFTISLIYPSVLGAPLETENAVGGKNLTYIHKNVFRNV